MILLDIVLGSIYSKELNAGTQTGISIPMSIVASFMRERERERERQRHRQRNKSSMLGARSRTRSRDPRIAPWAKGRRQNAEPPRDPRILFFLRFYLFIHDTERERERERGRDTGRGRSRLHAGSPMGDTTPGLQDHALG